MVVYLYLREHVFFKRELPAYIAEPIEDYDAEELFVDMDVIDRLVQLGIAQNEVITALNEKGVDHSFNKIYVTYKILVAEMSTKSLGDEIHNIEEKEAKTLLNDVTKEFHSLCTKMKEDKNNHWTVGIPVPQEQFDYDDWSDVMICILEALQVLPDVSWRRKIEKRQECKVELQINSSVSSVQGCLQLYSDRTDHSVHLDFHHLSGDKFLFMTTASKIEQLLEQELQWKPRFASTVA
jgi:hypothetical protein